MMFKTIQQVFIKSIFFTLLFSFSYLGYAQQKVQKHTISGYVNDATNGEILIGATVYSKEKLIGTTANVYGFYSS